MVRDEDYSVGVLLEVVDSKLLIGWIIYELINMAQNDKSFKLFQISNCHKV